ncbi:HU family DNA-binding protein [Patescibacteria group bacterium]|nr:HU family DNA-binding protein [Patescibacteria group bacterium]MBU1868652.1 HU family DNA-binding protein [Patescibacteria group bacterium]
MTKTELIEQVAERTSLTKSAGANAVNAVIELIGEALARGDKVTVTGFGTFLVRRRAARMGRNPQTGEPLHIPAQNTPAFRAGTALKDIVR